MPITTTITTESELAAWVSARNAQTGVWADEQWGEIDSPGINITSTITLNPGGSGPGAVLRPFSSRSIASSIRAIYGARATLYARDFSGLVLQGSRAVVDGLQLSRGNADGGSYSVQNGAVIRNSILDQGASNNVLVSSGGTGGFIDTCLLIGKSGGSWLADGTGALWLRNCVLWANGAASGVRSNFGDAGAINSVFVGFTTDVSGTALAGSTNNSTTNASWGGTGWGTNGQTSISAAANFVNVGAGSEDFTTIDTTPNLRDTGATIAGLTSDFFGNTRPRGPSYDRGLTELAAAAVDGSSSGVTLTLTASLVAGSASASSNATAAGVTFALAAALLAGGASSGSGATVPGVTLTPAASLVAGLASGGGGATLDFQAAGMELIARTGLALSTFAREVGVTYRVEIFANGLTLGSPLLTSGVLTTDSNGKLPNLQNPLLVSGTTYRVVPVRQSDGEAGYPRRMVAA